MEVGRNDQPYRYAGGMFVRRLKKSMTRQVSRSPSPYAIGPSVPAENLPPPVSLVLCKIALKMNETYDRILKFAEKNTKKTLL